MTNKQHRVCFLCGCRAGEQLFQEQWEIISLGQIDIGVRICSGCGLVLQDPAVPFNAMSKYYSEISNYTNPGRSGLPSKAKIAAVKRQLSILRRYVSNVGSAFQVGSSDGYTLHCFEQMGWSVLGVDPSPAATRLAKIQWGLDLDVGFFEDYLPRNNSGYDLIILTHVLEHIYDPTKTLKKCKAMLHPDGRLLIEVPALIEPSCWPSGYFSFEHVNYFSTQSMINTLNLAGFEIVGEFTMTKTGEHYPVMTCVARPKSNGTNGNIVSDFSEALRICNQYMQFETDEWRRIDVHLRTALNSPKRVVIWGAGIHTSQLLARTRIIDYGNIEYMVDSDAQKWGLTLGKYPIKAPDQIPYQDEDLIIIISSCQSEAEIYKTIACRTDLNAKVIRLYHEKGSS